MDVELRPYSQSDTQAVFEAVHESFNELHPWMPWCRADYSVEEARSWLGLQVRGFEEGTAFQFAILAKDGRYLGAVGLNEIDRLNRKANLGYWVRSAATGRGVATAAVRALRDWAFERTALIRLEILIAAGNVASHRVAERAGAIREGVLRRRLVLHDVAHDATMFSITRDLPVQPGQRGNT
ncbi:MAG: GNAT family N-acetyltransferase [Vicinamibacterales bacterium]